MSLASVEQFTGGLLGHIIADSVLSSQFYSGGIIINSDISKIGMCIPSAMNEKNVAVTGEVAETMAESVKEKFSTDFGLSVTGIAHNRGPLNQADIVYVGVADAHGTKSWPQQFMINRADSCERAAVGALFRLRERLIETKIM
jgi:nicotinamide-nucleotide amidase